MKKRNLLAGEATGTVLRSDMQIVIPDDATVLCRRSAGRLAQALTLNGLAPAIVTGQGATARQTVRMTLGNGGMTYRVTADGAGNCNLTAGCDRALQQAVLELCGKEKNGRLPQISAVEGNAENLLRVMYYNVYGYGNLDSVPDRLGQQAALIADAAPDVLCVQEFDRLHRAGAKPLLEKAGYSEVPVTEDGGFLYPAGKNCEAIFYRADRLELLRSGGEPYPDRVEVDGAEVIGNNSNTKSTAWAIFRERTGGKIFLAVNTHFMWSAPELTGKQANAVRVDNARRMVVLIDAIRALDPAYANLAVIFGGDLNCGADSDPCAVVKTVLTPVYDMADTERDNIGYYGVYATYDETTGQYRYGEIPSEGGGIDHVFAAGLTVRNYLTDTCFRARITSDHLPKTVDLILN